MKHLKRTKKKLTRKKGMAMLAALSVLMLLGVATTSYIDSATHSARMSKRQTAEIATNGICEAGVQAMMRSLWRPFKVNQDFTSMDGVCAGASTGSPRGTAIGTINGVGKYSVGVVAYSQPAGNPYVRNVTIRSVGWMDRDADNVVDDNEPRKTVDIQARYELARSAVFDYTYFVNNYGWMSGFGPNDLVVNGDMRANGNFDFLNGSPTVNGSIIAANNDKLTPAAAGRLTGQPFKWDNNTYRTNAAGNARMRPGYNSSEHGARGTTDYENWRDFIFDTSGAITNGRTSGAVLADTGGTRAWERTSGAGTSTQLDSDPTKELVMPDLNDITEYQTLSQSYTNPKANYGDGTPNPNFGSIPYIEVWNTSTGAYQRITTNGVLTGSAVIVGSSTKPIKVHGPVTVTQDVVIKGVVEGQGTIYAGRNAHVVGSLTYKNPPDFRGSNAQSVEFANEKKDLLALCARGSVILGNPKTFSDPYPLYYMKPPFTKGRYDELGNYIPPFDATQTDATGFKRYQSVFGDNALDAIATGVNQVDAILYSNFVGGGNIGTSGGGVTFNGTLICRDEALVTWSLPVNMNYDNRIKEKAITQQPVIDIKLPRSPVMLRSTWQDRGFMWTTADAY